MEIHVALSCSLQVFAVTLIRPIGGSEKAGTLRYMCAKTFIIYREYVESMLPHLLNYICNSL